MNTYIIKLTDKNEIQIDADELPNVIEAISTKSLVKVKQGILNPAFLVCIIEDRSRQPEIGRTIDTERHEMVDVVRPPRALRDIFADVPKLTTNR